jgi:hypothetical protein
MGTAVVDIDSGADALRQRQCRRDIGAGRFAQPDLQRRRRGPGAKAGHLQQAVVAPGRNEMRVVTGVLGTPRSPGEGCVIAAMQATRANLRPIGAVWSAAQKTGDIHTVDIDRS